jgi:hypothetical protein
MSDDHINPLELRKMYNEFLKDMPKFLAYLGRQVQDNLLSKEDFKDASQGVMGAYMILYTRYINSERNLTEASRK